MDFEMVILYFTCIFPRLQQLVTVKKYRLFFILCKVENSIKKYGLWIYKQNKSCYISTCRKACSLPNSRGAMLL